MTAPLRCSRLARRLPSLCVALGVLLGAAGAPRAQDAEAERSVTLRLGDDGEPVIEEVVPDVETGLEGAVLESAEELRAELARIELRLATERDFAWAQAALDDLAVAALRGGRFEGWLDALVELHLARVDLLIDRGEVERAAEAAGRFGVSFTFQRGDDIADVTARAQQVLSDPRARALQQRIAALLARDDQGSADLRSVVEAALQSDDDDALRELGSRAVPVLLDLLAEEVDQARSRWPLDPLEPLLQVVRERLPRLLDERFPAPPVSLLARLSRLGAPHVSSNQEAWVGCDRGEPRFAWVDWIPWFARMVRAQPGHEALRGATRSIVRGFGGADAVPAPLEDALVELALSSDPVAHQELFEALDLAALDGAWRRTVREGDTPTVRRLASLDTLSDVLLNHADVRLRRFAAAQHAAREDLGNLRARAGDPDPMVRLWVARGLGDLALPTFGYVCGGGWTEGTPVPRGPVPVEGGDAALLHRLARDSDTAVSLAALEALASGRYGPLPIDEARAVWGPATSSTRAALLAVDLAPPEAWAALLAEALADPSPAVRRAAVEVIAGGETVYTQALHARLRESPDAEARRAAVLNTHRLHDGEALAPELRAALDDPAERVRLAVLEQLEPLPDDDWVEIAEALTRDPAQDVARSTWMRLREVLFEVGTHGRSAPAVELARRAFADGRVEGVTSMLGTWNSGRGSLWTRLLRDAAGLRALTLWALEEVDPSLWDRLFPDRSASAADEASDASAVLPRTSDYADAWNDFSDEQLARLLEICAELASPGDQQKVRLAALVGIVEALEPARLARVLELAEGGPALESNGWLRVAKEAAPDLALEALDRLAALIVEHGFDLIYGRGSFGSNWLGLKEVPRDLRVRFAAEQVAAGRPLEDLTLLGYAGLLNGLDATTEAGGWRRRLAEAVMARWGGDLEDLFDGWAFIPAVLATMGPDRDLLPDARVLALAEDPRAWSALMPVVLHRRAPAFAPLLAAILTAKRDAGTALIQDQALALTRGWPAEVAEPLLLQVAETSHDSEIRGDCLRELEARAEVRAARAAWERRQGDEVAREAALDEVLALLEEADPLLRAEAVRALGTLGSAVQLPRLIRLLRDESDEVRAAAREAVDRLHARSAPGSGGSPEAPAGANDGG